MAELLKKTPVEKCWEITAKILTRFLLKRGVKTVMPLLGKEEGYISPVWGLEKFEEIGVKVFAEGGRKMLPMVKETFNIPVEDAVEAAKLVMVAIKLLAGPEIKYEIVEKTPEKAAVRYIKCPVWETYKELEVDPDLIICPPTHQLWAGEGFKAINPKIPHKLTKALPWGDLYCEDVIECKVE